MVYEIEVCLNGLGKGRVCEQRAALNLFSLAVSVFTDFPEADYFYADEPNGKRTLIPRTDEVSGFKRGF